MSVISLQNQIAAIRSQIASLMMVDSNHSNHKAEISQLRNTLSSLEDALYSAKMKDGLRSTPTQQRSNKSRLNQTQLRRLLEGGAVVEARDIFTTTSGIVVPEIYQQWTTATRWTSPLVGMVTRWDRNGHPQYVKTSIVDDTGASQKMSLVAEGGSTSAIEADPTITVEVNGSDVILSKIRYSVELEEDSFAFQNFLNTTAAARVSRGLSYVLTTGKDEGTGTAMPNSVTGGLLQSAAVAGVAAATGAISYTDLVTTLKGSLDESYRQNAVYMASQSAHDYLEAQVDGEGRPLYKHDDQGYLLVAGQRVYINSAMVFTTAAPAVLYGQFSKALGFLDGGSRFMTVREAPGLVENRLAELNIYSRIGSAPLLTSAVKSLTAK